MALIAAALAAAAGWLMGQRRDGLTQAAEAILPATVTIYPRGALETASRAAPLGSGFVVDDAGRVVTSDSALGDGEVFAVELSDGERRPARRVARDPASDLALLRLESTAALRTVQWGDSRTLRPGDWVLAAGRASEGTPSLNLGVVTASDRRPVPNGLDYVLSDAVAADALGAPLVDRRGRVVGVVVAIDTGPGADFALGSEDARTVVVRLVEEAETRGN